MHWPYSLVIFPSAVLAVCKFVKVCDVRVDMATLNVSWNSTYEPGRLTGFQVCWTSMKDHDVWCDMTPAGATSLSIAGGVEPCERFSFEVTALGSGNRHRDSSYGHAVAGPPLITGLRLTQTSRNSATLEWSPVTNHPCVTSVELWLCDDQGQDLSTCVYKKMNADTSKFRFQQFQVCRRYYVTVSASGSLQKGPTTSLDIYLDSANEVTKIEAGNVTKDSAVITWWVSDVKFRCQTERMKLCLQEEGSSSLPECWEWTLDQDGPSDSMLLTDLEPCASYDAMVSLVTSGKFSHRNVTFTTAMASQALRAVSEAVNNTAALVRWSFDVASTDCKPTVMRVCYWRNDTGSSSKMCRTVGTAARSSLRLTNLAPCTLYTADLTLLTSAGAQPSYTLSLVTASRGVPVLKAMNLSAAGANVTVRWTPTDASLQCVSHFNVSWSTASSLRGRSWRAVDPDDASYTIVGVSRRAAYNVQVAAVFVDGTSQSLSGHLSTSGCTRLLSKFSHLTNMLPVLVFLREHLHR